MSRTLLACSILSATAGAAHAGTVAGKLELPAAPERAPLATRGFLDRSENPLAPVKAVNVAGHLALVLEGDAKPPADPGQITWSLVGESFARSVIAVPVNTDVVVKNDSKTARTLTALEDPALVPHEPINPTGPKNFKVAAAGKAYTITDKDAPHLVGKLVVVNTPFVARPDDAGKFEFTDVPPGEYKLRIYYFDPAAGKDGWLDRPADVVTVGGKGATAVNPKLTAGYAVAK